MKVKELIRQLQQYDPEARVYYGSWMGKGSAEILASKKYAGMNEVILEDASEFDVYEELQAMRKYYSDNDYDETVAYQDMVDRGYTPELVAVYDKDFAEVFKRYCSEHGIE